MNPLLAQLVRNLIYTGLGIGVEKVVEGFRRPAFALGEGDVAAIRHPRACSCPSCDDRFILGLDDEDE